MDRWLVSHLSSPALAIVVIACFAVPALLGVWALRRWRPGLTKGLNNDITGVVITVMAAVYGVMLAFVIVVLYEDFRDAQSDVHTESGALSSLYRSTQQLPQEVALPMTIAIRDYVSAVTGPEWKTMTRGDGAPEAWAKVNEMYVVLGRYDPVTASQRAFFDHSLTALSDVTAARRSRLDAAKSSLPPPFVVLVVFGGYLLLFFMLLFDLNDPRYHRLVVLSVATLIGFSLTLALALEFPFSGGISVSPEPFHQGGLGDLSTSRP